MRGRIRGERWRGPVRQAIFLVLLVGGPAAAHDPAPPGSALGVKTVLVVPIQHQNPPCPSGPCQWIVDGAPGPPRHSATAWQLILNSQVNDYYLKASHGKTSFQFTVATNPGSPNGWFVAPHTINDYESNPNPDQTTGVSLGQDAMALADPAFDLTLFSRILVIHNFQRRGAMARWIEYDGNGWPILFTLEGSTDAEMIGLVSHELGHTFGLPDLYGVLLSPDKICEGFADCPAPDNVGPWDLMAMDPAFTHFSGYSKYEAGWIPQPTSTVVDLQLQNAVPFSQNYTLRNLAEPGQNLIRIRTTSDPGFDGYYVECRTRKAGLGDENIPEEGVLVTRVNRGSHPSSVCGRHMSVHAASNFPDDICDAALPAGETHFASFTGLSITNTGMDQNECSVEVTWNGNGSSVDPAILEGAQFDSPDIWVDSSVNGWGVYGPPTQALDADGAPLGPGDPVWPGQPHRIVFRLRNFGMSTATNVTVEVGVRQPLTVPTICGGVLGPATVIGTVNVPSLPPSSLSGSHLGYVDWVPTSEPARIEVRVPGYVGEVTQANNSATDSVEFYFPPCEDPANCPVEATPLPVLTRNPCARPAILRAMARFLPPGWDVMIQPAGGLGPPGAALAFDVQFALGGRLESAGGRLPFVEIPIELFQAFGDPLTGEGGDWLERFAGVRTLHFFLPEAAVGCSSPAGQVPVGTTAVTTGLVDPPLSGSPVSVEYTSPSGATFLRLVTTGAGGAFTSPLAPDEEGTWSVRALWAAEETHRNATSAPCDFTACGGPPQPVTILQVTQVATAVMLHVDDPNPAGETTGYNIYRSATANPPASGWSLLAQNARDQEPLIPGVQWLDRSGAVSPTRIWYYQVAPYDATCPAEGPW